MLINDPQNKSVSTFKASSILTAGNRNVCLSPCWISVPLPRDAASGEITIRRLWFNGSSDGVGKWPPAPTPRRSVPYYVSQIQTHTHTHTHTQAHKRTIRGKRLFVAAFVVGARASARDTTRWSQCTTAWSYITPFAAISHHQGGGAFWCSHHRRKCLHQVVGCPWNCILCIVGSNSKICQWVRCRCLWPPMVHL